MLNADTFKICYAYDPDLPRPETFDTEGDRRYLYVYERVKSDITQSTLGSGDGWKRISPFTAVSVREDDRVSVEFKTKTYWLISIDDLATGEILKSSRRQYGPLWEKRFVEDIAEVLAGMGNPPGATVKLVLVDQKKGKKRVVSKAPLTHENRREVYRKYNSTSAYGP